MIVNVSSESRANRIYEDRVVKDSLARLSASLTDIPFTHEELHTLAKRARQAFYGSEKKKERLVRYKAHLSRIYGDATVAPVFSKLEEINNQIGYEEK